MKRMQSPIPNRKGVYEIHEVPSRKADQLASRGWSYMADAEKSVSRSNRGTKAPDEQNQPQSGAMTESLQDRAQFDLSGPWLSTRSRVRKELNIDRMPESKDEARVLLEDAGYEVTGV